MSTNILGGAITGANAGTGSTGVSGQYSSSKAFWSQPVKPRTVYFEVQHADNGYVLRYSYQEGEYTRLKVAKDMEEMRDLITSILVEHKLGI
jgi:hypothetical protein